MHAKFFAFSKFDIYPGGKKVFLYFEKLISGVACNFEQLNLCKSHSLTEACTKCRKTIKQSGGCVYNHLSKELRINQDLL